MTTTISYGKAATCLLDAAEATLLRPRRDEFLPPDQIAAYVRAQLAQPINYPPLSQSTIPGDTVVLAIEPEIPQQLQVVDGVLRALQDAGVDDSLITVLLASSSTIAEALQDGLVALGHSRCQVKVHDPDNEKEIAFLGVSQNGRALRLSRTLCEADLVLPVTAAKGELTPCEQAPFFTEMFPLYSDRETNERIAASNAEKFPCVAPEISSEIEECGRQLGAGLCIRVIPAVGGQVAALLTGDHSYVARQANEAYREIWQCDAQLRGNLVIATVAGGVEQQTWQNVGRALAAAEAILEPGGCIAICSELAEPPGLALSQLFGTVDYDVARREIQQNPGTDSKPAIQLCQTLERYSIYLRSQLSPAVVESLGMTPLASDSELEHLAQTLRPCIVLEEAQRLLPSLVEVEA